MAHHLTTCTFCGVGCGLYLETADNRIVGVYPSPSHPSNSGRLCLRGWHVHEIANSPDRLKRPLIKKNGSFQETSWEEAFSLIAARLSEIRDQHGPDSLAFLNSPRCSNEEAYLLQKFARSIVGTNNVDHGTGVYSNNSVDTLLEMIGVPATTGSISELAHSDVILVDGVDLARRLPTLGGTVIRAKIKGARLIAIGTRRHRVAQSADIFLQIRPQTEQYLYGAMAKIIEDRGLMDLNFIKARCQNYEEFRSEVGYYDLLQAADICGVSPELIEAAALLYAQSKSSATLYSTGIEFRSPDHIRALVNLTLLTGNLGKPGAGIFALSEQNNLQGVCDVGMLPNRLPGYLPVTNGEARAALERQWGAELPSRPGASARSLLAGEVPIKALWLCRYDPVSTAAVADAAGAIRQCKFVVVQHLFMTETAKYADVILPTTAYGEEQVSFTSTDRRVQVAEKVVEPPLELTPAWWHIVQVARHMGARWDYPSAGEVMREIAEVIEFYSGVNYENLTTEYGRQWPCTKEKPLGTRHLFADRTGGRRFNFVAIPVPAELDGKPTRQFPFTLVFGHSLYYWNQNVLIRHSETLKREYQVLLLDYPEGFVEINTEDAKALGIRDGERVRICTARATASSTARVTPEVRSGTLYVPYFVREVEEQFLGAADEGNVQVRVEKEAVA
ncbi:MAG TPA: molybdopterin-dependent oxidoreductase [Terriglobales bacterium]|nr:molybdopterin-dependent oxidoreductase [Terriglobales bacterium]